MSLSRTVIGILTDNNYFCCRELSEFEAGKHVIVWRIDLFASGALCFNERQNMLKIWLGSFPAQYWLPTGGGGGSVKGKALLSVCSGNHDFAVHYNNLRILPSILLVLTNKLYIWIIARHGDFSTVNGTLYCTVQFSNMGTILKLTLETFEFNKLVKDYSAV